MFEKIYLILSSGAPILEATGLADTAFEAMGAEGSEDDR